MARYLSGEADEHRQRLRDELLATTPAHFRHELHFQTFGAVVEVNDRSYVALL